MPTWRAACAHAQAILEAHDPDTDPRIRLRFVIDMLRTHDPEHRGLVYSQDAFYYCDARGRWRDRGVIDGLNLLNRRCHEMYGTWFLQDKSAHQFFVNYLRVGHPMVHLRHLIGDNQFASSLDAEVPGRVPFMNGVLYPDLSFRPISPLDMVAQRVLGYNWTPPAPGEVATVRQAYRKAIPDAGERSALLETLGSALFGYGSDRLLVLDACEVGCGLTTLVRFLSDTFDATCFQGTPLVFGRYRGRQEQLDWRRMWSSPYCHAADFHKGTRLALFASSNMRDFAFDEHYLCNLTSGVAVDGNAPWTATVVLAGDGPNDVDGVQALAREHPVLRDRMVVAHFTSKFRDLLGTACSRSTFQMDYRFAITLRQLMCAHVAYLADHCTRKHRRVAVRYREVHGPTGAWIS